LVKQFPDDEKYRLIDQLKRSSRPVPANIAEGNGRFHYQDNLKFCRNTQRLLNEILDHLIGAFDESLINHEQLESLRSQYNDCFRLLNGCMASLTIKQ
jgi:four helix bundle protein